MGVIEQLGDGVNDWKEGERVTAVPWPTQHGQGTWQVCISVQMCVAVTSISCFISNAVHSLQVCIRCASAQFGVWWTAGVRLREGRVPGGNLLPPVGKGMKGLLVPLLCMLTILQLSKVVQETCMSQCKCTIPIWAARVASCTFQAVCTSSS